MSVLTSGDKWPVAQQSGELVNVEIRPGVKQRMYKEEAIARGLLKEQEKPKDKERTRGKDKGTTTNSEENE